MQRQAEFEKKKKEAEMEELAYVTESFSPEDIWNKWHGLFFRKKRKLEEMKAKLAKSDPKDPSLDTLKKSLAEIEKENAEIAKKKQEIEKEERVRILPRFS